MSEVFVYEFLFRGGSTSNPDDNTYHVVLARQFVSIKGEQGLETTAPMSPASADELGFPLKRIVSEINESALKDVAIMRDSLTLKTAESERFLDAAVALANQIERLTGVPAADVMKAVIDSPAERG